MVIGKEKCYDFYGHPTSISGHNIIWFIAVWYIDITVDSVALGGGDGCHLRVVPPGQLHRRPSTPKRFINIVFFSRYNIWV